MNTQEPIQFFRRYANAPRRMFVNRGYSQRLYRLTPASLARINRLISAYHNNENCETWYTPACSPGLVANIIHPLDHTPNKWRVPDKSPIVLGYPR